MPVINEVGFSRHSTPFKQFALDRSLGHLLGRAAAVARKWNSRCYALDMTCGPGLDPYGGEGSPLIFAKHVQNLRNQGYPVEFICVDRHTEHFNRLEPLLKARFPSARPDCLNDQEHALRGIPKGALGVSYWDPTKYNDLDTELLSNHGRKHRYLDILLTRECLASRRMRGAGLPVLLIDEYLRLTGKEQGFIQRFADWGWWSFGFATNSADQKKLAGGGFYDIRSEKGQKFLRSLIEGETPEINGQVGLAL